MNAKKKEWIKDNCVSIIVHIIIILIYMVFIVTTLDLYGLILSDTSTLANIFASVTVFGALTFFTVFLIYMDLWSKRIREFKHDYDKHMEK